MTWLILVATTHGLLGAAAAHGVLLAAGLAGLLALVMLGALLTVVLVALVPRERRVEAIRATADVLAVLLPWPARRDSPRRPLRRIARRRWGSRPPR